MTQQNTSTETITPSRFIWTMLKSSVCLKMDQALTALITEVRERGLDQSVMVVAYGELGRTPRVTHAPVNFSNQIGLGRDHSPNAFSALVAGGGLRMGQVIGQTNSQSEYPAHNPGTPQDLLVTIYRHMKIDYRHEFTNFAGHVPLLSSGQPISQLI